MSFAATPDLLGVLRKRQQQARTLCGPYIAPVASRDAMLFWISRAAKSARETAERKQVHIAAGADMDQSSVWRFEEKGRWPRDPDKLIAAYADDLDIDAFDLWEESVRLWREDRTTGGATQLHDDGAAIFQEYDATQAGGTSAPPDPPNHPTPAPADVRRGRPARTGGSS